MQNAKWNGTQFKNITHKQAFDLLDWCVKFVEGEAKMLVPIKTGNLMSSIHGVVDKTRMIGIVMADRAKLMAKAGTKVYYATFVEFGTWASRVPPFNTSKKGMKPRPYLRPALDKLKQKLGAL